MGFEQTNRAQKDTFDSIGFNLEWAVTDSGTLKFDAHTDTAESTPDNPLGHSATFVAIATPIIAGHEVNWQNGNGFPVQTYTFDDEVKGNDNLEIDVGDLGSQVARSSTQLQNMDVDEFDLRYSVKSENGSLDFGANLRQTQVQVVGVTTQQDLGSWGIANPRDVEANAPGVMEAFCMSCRFDDYPVGQAQVAFRGDATDLFGPLSAAYPGNAVSINASGNQVDEDILAFYAQFGLQSELLGRPVSITGGLRYEKTEVEALAAQAVPTQIRWTADNDFVIDYSGTAEAVDGRRQLQPPAAEHRHQDGCHGQRGGAHVVQRDHWSRSVRQPVRRDDRAALRTTRRSSAARLAAARRIRTCCRSSRRTSTYRSSGITVTTAICRWDSSTRP